MSVTYADVEDTNEDVEEERADDRHESDQFIELNLTSLPKTHFFNPDPCWYFLGHKLWQL